MRYRLTTEFEATSNKMAELAAAAAMEEIARKTSGIHSSNISTVVPQAPKVTTIAEPTRSKEQIEPPEDISIGEDEIVN